MFEKYSGAVGHIIVVEKNTLSVSKSLLFLLIIDREDFLLMENSTVFLAGPGSPDIERRNCFRVDIIDDTHHEGVETFTLTSDHMEQSRVHLQPNVTEVIILNSDGELTDCLKKQFIASISHYQCTWGQLLPPVYLLSTQPLYP